MESTGLEEPFWYIIISTGGTFIILATTVLVFGKLTNANANHFKSEFVAASTTNAHYFTGS